MADNRLTPPFVRAHDVRDGRATAHVCVEYACRLPVTDPDALDAELDATASATTENRS